MMGNLKWALLVFFFHLGIAFAESPLIEGLGGGGRGGIAQSSLFTNPASVTLIDQSTMFLFYRKPSIPQWNAGGRAYALGVYDGQNPVAKGGFGYFRSSRARIDNSGLQTYEDRSDFRFSLGTALWSKVSAGLGGRYVTRRIGGQSEKFFNGDVGALFPLFAGATGGITYENILTKAGERPASLGAGIVYNIGYGFKVYGDGYRFLKAEQKGKRGWSLAGELDFATDFRLRYARFQEGYRRMRGWSAGLSWVGPRTSFEYSLKNTGSGPKEKDHTFGMTVAL